MQKQWLLAISYCVILLFSLFDSVSFGKNNIIIGVIGPMKHSLGKDMWNGAVLAAENFNKGKKVRVGKKMMGVKLIKIDSGEFIDASSSANAAEMLFFRNKVDFLVGGFRSEAVLAVQDVAMDHKKIFISAGAASLKLTQRVAQNYDRYKYYFRGGTFNNYDLGKACFLQLAYVSENMKNQLGTEKLKVAIAADRSVWVDRLIKAAEKNLPNMGLTLAGVFRPSPVATDLTTEIRGIAKTEAPIVLTWFSDNLGALFVTQANELKLPVVMVGINPNAVKNNFLEATDGKGDYVMTLASFAPDVEMTSQTKSFVDRYARQYNEVPSFVAGGTYTAIACTLIPAVRNIGTLDADRLVQHIENDKYETPHGIFAYQKDEMGRHMHEIKFGAEYVLPLGIQWQNGKMKAVWPKDYYEKPGVKPLTYKGVVDFQIPDYVIEMHKKEDKEHS